MAPLFTGSKFGFGLGPLVVSDVGNVVAGTYLDYGWYGGATGSTAVDRIDWANDTVTASARGSNRSSSSNGGGLSNLTHGWFSGGYTAGGNSTVDRITYASDLSGGSARADCPQSSNGRPGGFSNTTYGYWGPGMNGNGGDASSAVTRVDFANDLTAPANRTNTASPYIAHTGGASDFSTYGWMLGGGFGGAGGVTGPTWSSVYRLTYASDTSALSTRGNLANISTGFACGNQTHCWIGGSTDSLVSSITRVTFSNDLATSTNRGNLVRAMRRSGSGSNTYIWWAGGYGSGNNYSDVERMEYVNDLSTLSPRGPMSLSRQCLATNHMTLG